MAAWPRSRDWPAPARQLAADLAALLMAVAAAVLAVFVVAGCHRGEEPAAPAVSAPAVSPTVPAAPARAVPPAPAATVRGVPAAALRHRADLTRCARAAWGLDAPVAVMAAQIHQESGWRADARSPVGAQGMAQFMPATATWIAGLMPELAGADPYNPAWAMRALASYDKWLWDRVESAVDPCHRFAFALSGYNGGLGWVRRDAKLAASQGLEPDRWWDHVETVNAGRSESNWRENRGYPRRILRQLTPLYVAAGFGPGVACD
jgi:soluble lytic murein transglycosylase-like protein